MTRTDLRHKLLRYQVGGSLAATDPCYVERKADQGFYQNLRDGQFCYVFNSRQMGKSSLRVRAMRRLQAEGVRCLCIQTTDLISERKMSLEQWYWGVVYSIVMDLELYERFDAASWWAKLNSLSVVQRFSQFIGEVLLEFVPEKIVIFIDEIDRVLSLGFSLDGFFAVIRECYNKRADRAAYERLTFALIGVATPSDLIRDELSTPFNIGCAIDLTGFTLEEALPLAKGLLAKASDPEVVLAEILKWTGGQPFLTQKLCLIVQGFDGSILMGQETSLIQLLVESYLIQDWETQDQPEHFRTIQNRILRDDRLARKLLKLYREILQTGELAGDGSIEQIQLRLSGLVVKKHGKLKVYNPIYQRIFNEQWIEKIERNVIRPYADQIQAWELSDRQDESKLLIGQECIEAWEWAMERELQTNEYSFLYASETLDQKVKSLLTNIKNKPAVIKAVMSWTEGQKALNDAIFNLLSHMRREYQEEGQEEEWVSEMIRSHWIGNWKAEETAEPLRKMRDLLIQNKKIDSFWLLVAYRKVLIAGGIEPDENAEQKTLQDMGIVTVRNKNLVISNRIYKSVFGLSWTNQHLNALRPYASSLVEWLDSDRQDSSKLLSGRQLKNAQTYAKDNKIDQRETQYIIRSIVWDE